MLSAEIFGSAGALPFKKLPFANRYSPFAVVPPFATHYLTIRCCFLLGMSLAIPLTFLFPVLRPLSQSMVIIAQVNSVANF
jgi:hypothetical protein